LEWSSVAGAGIQRVPGPDTTFEVVKIEQPVLTEIRFRDTGHFDVVDGRSSLCATNNSSNGFADVAQWSRDETTLNWEAVGDIGMRPNGRWLGHWSYGGPGMFSGSSSWSKPLANLCANGDPAPYDAPCTATLREHTLLESNQNDPVRILFHSIVVNDYWQTDISQNVSLPGPLISSVGSPFISGVQPLYGSLDDPSHSSPCDSLYQVGTVPEAQDMDPQNAAAWNTINGGQVNVALQYIPPAKKGEKGRSVEQTIHLPSVNWSVPYCQLYAEHTHSPSVCDGGPTVTVKVSNALLQVDQLFHNKLLNTLAGGPTVRDLIRLFERLNNIPEGTLIPLGLGEPGGPGTVTMDVKGQTYAGAGGQHAWDESVHTATARPVFVTTVLAKAKIRVTPGRRVRLILRLTAAGRRLLSHRHPQIAVSGTLRFAPSHGPAGTLSANVLLPAKR
jgi:hypothetical protein